MMRAASLVAPIMLSLTTAGAPAAPMPLRELPSVMVVSKSSNSNEVHYAVSVDGACAAVATAPVRPYWRMNEKGGRTEGLSRREDAVLGVARQHPSADGIQFTVRGFPSRAFVVHTGRASDGSCTSSVDTTIAGTPARLVRVYVKQKFSGGVDYVLLSGRTADGRNVDERIRP
jgi:hypothetical protein